MLKTLVKFLFIASISINGIPRSNAQTPSDARHLSIADSILVNRYLDTVNNHSIFSQKYQLYFDSALAICPWKAYWWQQKAMPLYKRKKYEAGAPYLDSAVKYDAHRYIDYRAFMKCIFQKSYHESINDFQTAKTIIGAGEVMDHTYDFYIGLCYLQLNQLDSSEHYLVQTIEQQKQARGADWVHFLDLFYLGVVYYEKENYTKAIEMLDNCLKTYKNFSDAEYYKAICLARSNNISQALSVMKQAQLDFQQGYTINEDNVVYETYPYQIDKPVYYSGSIESLEAKAK